MAIAFYIVNGTIGTLGSYLVFRRFRELGLLAAGAALVVASLVSMPGERWWPMGVGIVAAFLLNRLIGDPLDA